MVTSTAGKTNLGFIYLLVSNFFLGIGFAWLISIVTLIFTEEYAAKRDSAIIGLHLCLGLGSASCPMIINYFYSQKMWAMSIMIYLILLGIVFACSMAMGLANLREADEKSESAPSVKSKMPKGAQLFLLAVFIYGIVEGLLGIWSYFYLAQVKMFTMKTVATSIAFFWLFVTLGRLVKSIVALKLDARFLYRLSPVLMVLSFAGICFIQTESQMVLCYMAAGLACSAFFPLTVSLSTRYFYEERDKLCSLSVAVLMLGSLVGSVGVGLLQSVPGFQLSFAFQATILAALLLLVLSLKLTPQGAKPASAQPA
jgi:fucose permease